jgi:sigma-B regulation protein RsbU (phosphoserine phosphatase)
MSDGRDDGGAARRLLLADDSPTQRRLLRALLEPAGFEALEAADGDAALRRWRAERPALLLTDWMMPGLSGPELCRAIRAEERAGEGRTYILLLTARHETADLAAGLEAGADDFVSKPVSGTELLARLEAGRRAAAAEARLLAESRRIEEAHARLARLHDRLEADIRMAGLLQREFSPAAFALCNGAPCAAICRQVGHVGGDLVGYFPVGRHTIGLYAIDVSGHGVAAALRAVQLAQLLHPGEPGKNLAFRRGRRGEEIRDPAETVAELNRRCLAEGVHDLFFTIALAVLDLATGEGRICRAGHPPPAILHAGGAVSLLEGGTMPVGMLAEARYASEPLRLAPGERLLLYSDGLSEAMRPDGRMLGGTGLAAILADEAGRPAADALPRLVERVRAEAGRAGFEDDVSALLIERPRPPGQAA